MTNEQPKPIFRDGEGQPELEYEVRAREVRRKMEYLRSLRLAGLAKQEAKRANGGGEH